MLPFWFPPEIQVPQTQGLWSEREKGARLGEEGQAWCVVGSSEGLHLAVQQVLYEIRMDNNLPLRRLTHLEPWLHLPASFLTSATEGESEPEQELGEKQQVGGPHTVPCAVLLGL
jgi:hypothetical protein